MECWLAFNHTDQVLFSPFGQIPGISSVVTLDAEYGAFY
jgi:hypothetical protein